MCMVSEHISAVYEVTASMTEGIVQIRALQNRRIRYMVWLHCLAVLIASPQNFFVSDRDLKIVHKVVSECALAGLFS